MTCSVKLLRPFCRIGSGLLLLFLLGAVGFAQEQPRKSDSTSQQGQQHKTRNNEHKSMAGELAEETREAAGEEDENAQFKQSGSIKLLARITGLSQQHAYWLAVMLNFGVVALAIVWVSRKFLPGIFRARTAAIQKAMEEARKASADARRRLADIEARLSRLDVDIGGIRKEAAKESAEEEARIKAAAEEDARKIVQTAEQEISAAVKQARRELAAYAADLAISQAQTAIRVDAGTDQALVRGFAEQISGSNSGPSSAARKKGGQ
jgi:F-type H+-transporting ATPase subunit b